MKKYFYFYLIFMCLIIIVLPMIIIRGCSNEYFGAVPTEKATPTSRAAIKSTAVLTPGDPAINANTNSFDINVYFHKEKTYKKLSFEDYITGVVAAEMPSSFNAEALKAQAVAARTYAYARYKGVYKPRDNSHPDSPICTDYGHCQAYISYADMIKNCGKSVGAKNWAKVKKAVYDTSNTVITYKGKLCNPLFHSCSGGQTEEASLVWGGAKVPYLVSVKSEGEESCPAYQSDVTFSKDDIINKMKPLQKDASKDSSQHISAIEILERSGSGRVLKVYVDGYIYKGIQMRTALDLRSTNFTFIPTASGKIKIDVKGFGHGVGMSQYGANAMAKNGSTYQDILRHYYKGVKVSQI